MSDNKQGTGKNMTATFIALVAALVAGLVILIIALTSIIPKRSSQDETLAYEITSGVVEDASQNNDAGIDGFTQNNGVQNTVDAQGQNGSAGNQNNNDTTQQPMFETKTTKNEAVEHYEQLSPNGENKLSDHYDNKYIKQISSTYGVDSDLLVAIYSEPDTGNNFVLQFKNEKDANGNIVKSPDTLDKVYQIDEKGNVCIATGTQNGNVGVSYAEGMLCFNMIKTLVMTQYPEYFTGLD